MFIKYTVHNRWDTKTQSFIDTVIHLYGMDALEFKREIEKHYSNTLVTGHIEKLAITVNEIIEGG